VAKQEEEIKKSILDRFAVKKTERPVFAQNILEDLKKLRKDVVATESGAAINVQKASLT